MAPGRHPQTQPEAEHAPQPRNSAPGQPGIAEPGPDRHGERAARLDELQARADEAAARIEAQQAQQDAGNQYTARMGREAQAGPEVGWQAEPPDEIEAELRWLGPRWRGAGFGCRWQTTSVVLVEACPASRAMSLMLIPGGGLTWLLYPGLGDAVAGRRMVGS